MDLIEIRLTVSEMFENVVNSFSGELSDLIKNKVYISGGVFKSLVLGEKINDWDFWFRDAASVEQFKTLIAKETAVTPGVLSNRDKLKLSKILFITDNSYTLSFPTAKIQFITVETGTPKDMISRFDFKHTQCYYDPMSGEMSCPTPYIISKQLRYNPKASTPLSALKRAFKFGNQGWTIADNEVEAIIKSVTGLDWKDPKVVKKQTSGLYSKSLSIDLDDVDEGPRAHRAPRAEPAFTIGQDVAVPTWGFIGEPAQAAATTTADPMAFYTGTIVNNGINAANNRTDTAATTPRYTTIPAFTINN